MYGILKEENGNCKINNKIYEQIIYNHMMMKVIRRDKYAIMSEYNYKANFINANEDLDIEKVFVKFKEFMKHEYSEGIEAFLEEDARLISLAFLSPIINGTGFAFKEVKGGEEKRFDIVINYNKKMYVLELKIWRGKEYHKKGLMQLREYLEQFGLDQGYPLIFDFRKTESLSDKIEVSEIEIKGNNKKITEVYC